MGILGQAVAEPQAWYTEGWVLWLLAAACIVGPSIVSYLISGGLRAKDMWGRMAVVLTALTCGIVIVASGWPPRLGIDLKGGVILVYEVDAAKRVSEQADDAARRFEEVINREEGLRASHRERQTASLPCSWRRRMPRRSIGLPQRWMRPTLVTYA